MVDRLPKMLLTARLAVTFAQRSDAGLKGTNEDSMGALSPEDPSLLTHKGVVAVIADGVSTADAGREAAELCVKSFLDDYYSTPETWTVETSSRKVLSSINQWLYDKGSTYREAHHGYVSTLSALVLKSRTAYVLHVGDTRVTLWRNGELRQLTRDHAVQVSGSEKYLARAMGFDPKIEVDLTRTPIERGDLFLLTSDGIHDFVRDGELTRCLAEAHHGDSEILDRTCLRLIELAKAAGSRDNLTCQILKVDALPDASADEYLARLAQLPFPPELAVGKRLDSFVVKQELHASKRSQLYVVEEVATGKQLVMKTPSVNYEDDPAYIERFLLEHWVGQRVKSRHLLRSVEPPADRSCLYSLREYVPGRTLRQWIDSHHHRRTPMREIEQVIDVIGQCVRGLIALHRREVLHQDLKPGNIVRGDDGTVTIIDFGSCFVAGIEEITAPIVRDKILGTASYAAPEYVLGIRPSERSDLYSLGCITYEMLTGKHPYGPAIEEARSQSDFDNLRYTPAPQLNPHVPIWMDRAIQRAVHLDAAARYEELTEFIYDLENPNPDYLIEEAPRSRHQPAETYKRLALLLAITQVITLYFLVRAATG
jgi:serine/threonine protein phosphatase PrpC